MRCLESNRNILKAEESKVEVHILHSIDQYQYALCFKTKTIERIYSYTTRDERGPISCLIPTLIHDNSILWADEGVIELIEELDSDQWSSSSYLCTISNTLFEEYQLWLIRWVKKNRKYTILEIGSNIRKFLSESIKYLTAQGKSIKSALLPDVCTYDLVFDKKERCSSTDLQEMIEWYRNYIDEDEDVLRLLLSKLNTQRSIYYRERISGTDKYWILENAKFVPRYSKITQEYNDDEALTAIAHQDTVVVYQNVVQLPSVAVQQTPDMEPITSVNDNSILLIIFLVAIFIIMIIVVMLFLTSRRATVQAVEQPVATVKST